ncbi:MAG: DUF3311 domain-containing protein [Abditibacteriales bacterium]|nr:DUF3311 domain-containing protein [Abditibacteriales bacterium]MDW8367884.1 DUF3311 domain-containing protein [Abditibacteriales bacterium]
MKWLLTLIVVIVILLHHDIWNWKNSTLVLGFIPIGLAYHIGYSCLAALTMWLLVRLAWPKHLEEDEKTP